MPYAPEGPRTSSYHAQTKGRLCHDANGGRVEQDEQQPIPRELMELNACGDLANASVGPPGAFGKMSDEWTGTLYLNGACVPVCAKATEAAHNPKLSAWPKDLQLDIVNDPDISTLDIQAWMLETKAPVVILRCIDGTDDRQFDQLVGELGHSCSYAIVRWKYRGQTLERLLLTPAGGLLLCAAFPDDGIPKRPTHHRRDQSES